MDSFFSSNAPFAILLSLIAGGATSIGAISVFFAKKTNTSLLAILLGFSAGVMIYISMAEIFPSAQESLINALGDFKGKAATMIAFFSGMFICAIIDFFVPESENPHHPRQVEELNLKQKIHKKTLLRTAIMTSIIVSLHNFPEGLATFAATLESKELGIYICFAVALHNIPEGLAVAIPVFYATGSKTKAFALSFASGMLEPLGAICGYLVLGPFINETTFGLIYASIAGIMIFISLDELLPSARKYGKHHHSIYAMILGMLVIGFSLLL